MTGHGLGPTLPESWHLPESEPEPGPAGLTFVGRRLVGDEHLPEWMHQLVAHIDGSPLPAPIRNLASLAPPGARHSSVLMLLADGPAGPDLLLTARAATLRSHAGQPAFPGGRNDPGEDAVTAALREGEEETGLQPSTVVPAALLPDLYLPPSGYLVCPVLAYWREPGEVGPVDPQETAAVARVPISELVDPANRGRVRHPGGYVGPAFQVADLLVWGFTAGLVDILLTLGGWSAPWDEERYFELADLG